MSDAAVGPLVAVLLFLATQTGAFLWWGGKMSQIVRDHERRLNDLEEEG